MYVTHKFSHLKVIHPSATTNKFLSTVKQILAVSLMDFMSLQAAPSQV